MLPVVEFKFLDIVHRSGHNVDCLRKSGIYVIQNNANGHCYVGSSCRVLVRTRQHLVELQAGAHHCEPLQRAVSKYGFGAFTVFVAEEVPDRENLQAAEQGWIDSIEYYNTAKSSRGPAGVKMRLSDAERARRRERILKINNARSVEETRQNTMKARAAQPPPSLETRERISNSLKGRQFSDEHLTKIKATRAANPATAVKDREAARRLNEALRNMTPEQTAVWKARISAGHTGKKLSEDHKAKIKAGMLKARNTLTQENHHG